jgi:cell division protein FtsN
MQKLIIIILAVLLSGGCDFIERINPFAEKADTLEIYRQQQDSIRREAMLRKQQEETRREQARVDSLKRVGESAAIIPEEASRYHLVAGAFKTPSYANGFHEYIRNQGYDSRIIMSENNFHLVTLRSVNDYRAAVNELRSLRAQGHHEGIWLYVRE